jgi:hypothetical protein
MNSSQRFAVVSWTVLLVACSVVEPAWDDDTAAAMQRSAPGDDRAAAPEGYTFSLNGTHPDDCHPSAADPTRWVCPTMWDRQAQSPSSCGGFGVPDEAYILHQRGVDWDGEVGEAELQGETYELATRGTVPYNQTVIIQCCPADPRRLIPQAFFDIKTCPDRCGPDDALCPNSCGPPRTFGGCRSCEETLIVTDRCDIALVQAGWLDPHAPHDLDEPSGDDKVVWDVYFRLE